MAFDKIVGVDGTTYQFPTLVRARISDNIEQVGSDENLAVIAALAPALATKSATTHNHNLADLTNNGIDKLGDVEIGVVGPNGIALEDKHTLQYEGSTSTWRNKIASGGVTVGDSRPATPIPGDAWFDSNDGTLYVYYADANTSQWVQVQANSALEGTILARLGAVESRATALEATPDYSPNYVINGGMDIWQRGLTQASWANAYHADRWFCNSSTSTIFSQDTSTVFPGSRYGLKATAGVAASTQAIFQCFETSHTAGLIGKSVTLSGYVNSTSSISMIAAIEYSTTVDAALVGGGSGWVSVGSTTTAVSANTVTRVSTTQTIPSNAKSIRIQLVTATAAPSASVVSFSCVQLEEGSVATPFRRNANSIQAELAACQRYYYRRVSDASVGAMCHAVGGSTTSAVAILHFPVNMRIAPAAVEYNPTLYLNSYVSTNGSISSISLNTSNTNTTTTCLDIAGSTITADKPYKLTGNGSLTAYLGFSAEL